METLSSKKGIEAWQNALIQWFGENGKDYPWRRTTDPYQILVSELMLQQTQIRTVLDKRFYENWLEKFPDLRSLAEADEELVLKAWEGLGYYNRARNLQKAARLIVEQKDGHFPTDPEQVKKLPGVGPYTAGAVCSFAFNLPTPIVDGNVTRVLARVLNFQNPVDTTCAQKEFWSKADQLTSRGNPRAYNSAMMELGQQVCRKGDPECSRCPVSKWCLSENEPSAKQLPIKTRAVKITRKTEQVVLLIDQEKVLLCQETGSQRNGLWRLPLLEDTPSDNLEIMGRITYPITRYQVEMTIFGTSEFKTIREIVKKLPGKWFELENELPAIGAPYLRAIRDELERKGINL